MSEHIYEIHCWKGPHKAVIDILEDELSAEAKLIEYRELHPNYFWNLHRIIRSEAVPGELDSMDDWAGYKVTRK